MDAIQYVQIEPGSDPVLKTESLPYERLIALVGRPVEAHALFRGAAYLYLCEDGKRLALPFNHIATELLRGATRSEDFAVGTAIIVGPPDGDGHDTSVTDEVWKYVLNLAQREVGA